MSIRSLEDVPALERLCLIDISFSRLQTYTDCELKYYYAYILREDRVFGPAAQLGSTIHTVLEDTPMTGEFDLVNMLERMQEAREIHDPEHKISDDLMTTGQGLLSEFVDRHDGDSFDVIASEMPFAIVIGSALITGYIDRVDRDPNGTIRVIDYKTGKYEVTVKDAPTNLQLGIYALAMSHKFPNQPIRAELYYLRSGRIKGHTYTSMDLQAVEDRLRDLVDDILERQNYHPTEDRQKCRFCDYAANGVCATGARRRGIRLY